METFIIDFINNCSTISLHKYAKCGFLSTRKKEFSSCSSNPNMPFWGCVITYDNKYIFMLVNN